MDTHFRERERCVPIWLTVDPKTRVQILTTIAGLTALLEQIDGTNTVVEKPPATTESPIWNGSRP